MEGHGETSRHCTPITTDQGYTGACERNVPELLIGN